MTALIKRVTHGRYKGQYRFILKGSNGEIVATSELYTQKHNALEVIEACFPQFTIIDKTV